ncbi:hypothetical protein SAMN04487764_1692 [Gillisia sp. Hel1_33_143]|uniref:hypothetical protein n=1 Tax=Gillisia sp. Hel1_33_143 TaxID=1336796 RepID=UPI000879BA6E|nr:hypothetical protein [Gillisia sp. Hel1_33_143]SDS20673.1 hypothetical protein SAMN04487764_1692 [Gillisia sp. Hel1_33_143]
MESNFNQLKVYQKAQEIFKVSRAIACIISDNKNVMEMGISNNYNYHFAGEIVSDSLRLVPSLAVVHNTSNSSLRLKRANNIRKSANRMLIKCRKLEFNGVKETEFLNLLKSEILQFENLFTDWLNNLHYKKDE